MEFVLMDLRDDSIMVARTSDLKYGCILVEFQKMTLVFTNAAKSVMNC